MALRRAKLPWQARTMRPDILRLEDRVVPGEMFGTSMLWAMGAFADPAALVPDYSVDQGSVVRTTPAPDTSTPELPYADASTLSICQVDNPISADVDSYSANPAPAPDGSPAPPAAANASDQVFSDMIPDTDFTSLFPDLFGSTGSMGDLLHPGTQIPLIPSSALGAAASAAPFAAPAFTAPVLAGTGGGAQSGTGATLASLANSASAGSVTGTSSNVTTPTMAGDSGGSANPLFNAKKVVAPAKVHTNAANGAAPFSPQQIQQAYGINKISNTGSGQTIYIVDAYNDPNISRDLATFDAQWGLPAANLTVHKMSSRIRNSSSWGIEESLDVEWAHSIAPQANIVLVEATSSSYSALFSAVNWATNNGAHIVSMSWGGGDSSGNNAYDSYFNHSGVTYIASAGDAGGVVEYPSASPYVLSVGGTSLTLDSNNNYVSESAWSSGGGGASVAEKEPGYQTSYGISLSGRGTPDVAFDADPNTGVYVYDSYVFGGGGWYEVGGTSLGAPSWAGLIALADQGRSTPLSTNNLTSRTEYNAATGTIYAVNYHDITTGSNGYHAGPGYDLATGLGSPQANNLVPWLTSHS